MRRVTENDWRDIPGYDGMYQVSWDGQVRSWRPQGGGIGRREQPIIMKQYIKGGKYRNGGHCGKRYSVYLQKNGRRKEHAVMNLVIDVWVGGRPEGLSAYHKNGDIGDNCVNNIVFAPRSQICRIVPKNRRPVAKVSASGEVLDIYPSLTAAAKANYLNIKAVSNRCNGKVKDPGAFTFCWEK